MQTPSIPPNERQRVQVLHALKQLDTAHEQRFDRIVDIAKRMFEVPIVLISLLDSDRQWFKSQIGLDQRYMDRSISFCGHTILGDDPLVVEDALADRRFDDNPLVNGPPFIRFYSGAPLIITDEIRVGALCLIDTDRREFGTFERQLLVKLAGIVRDELVRLPAPTPAQMAQIIDGDLPHQRFNSPCAEGGSNRSDPSNP